MCLSCHHDSTKQFHTLIFLLEQENHTLTSTLNPNPSASPNEGKMKVLTLNFLSCAVKACKSTSTSFPLHPKECELEAAELEPNPKLLLNILPRLDWNALVTTASEVRSPLLPSMHPGSRLHSIHDFVCTDLIHRSAVRVYESQARCAYHRRVASRREDDARITYVVVGNADCGGKPGMWELWP